MAWKSKHSSFERTERSITRFSTRHFKNIENAVCKIDHHSPRLNVHIFMRPDRVKERYMMMKQILLSNAEFLYKINAIYRDEGVVECYNRDMHIPDSNVHRRLNHLWQIQCENFRMACRLNRTTAAVNTHMEKKFLSKNTKTPKYTVSKNVVDKYRALVMRKDISLINSLLRPKVYMKIGSPGMRPIGRFTIQLFTEACPDVVLAFTNLCFQNKFNHIIFENIFPKVWIQCKFKFDETEVKLKNPNIENNLYALNHGMGPGILSFPKSFLKKGFKSGFVNFNISFKPFSILNGEYLAFGIINRGIRTLYSMKEFGTINGKLRKHIYISHCGLFNKFSKHNSV